MAKGGPAFSAGPTIASSRGGIPLGIRVGGIEGGRALSISPAEARINNIFGPAITRSDQIGFKASAKPGIESVKSLVPLKFPILGENQARSVQSSVNLGEPARQRIGLVEDTKPKPNIFLFPITRVATSEVIQTQNPPRVQVEPRVKVLGLTTTERPVDPSPFRQHVLAQRVRKTLYGLKTVGWVQAIPAASTEVSPIVQNKIQQTETATRSESKPQKPNPLKSRIGTGGFQRSQKRQLTETLPINRDHEMNSRRENALNQALAKNETVQVEAEELIADAGILGDDYKSQVQIRRDGSQLRIANDLRIGPISRESIKTIVSNHTAIKVGEGGSDEATPREIREVLVLPNDLFEVEGNSEAVLRVQITREVEVTTPKREDSGIVVLNNPILRVEEEVTKSDSLAEPKSILPTTLDIVVDNNIAQIRRGLVLAL